MRDALHLGKEHRQKRALSRRVIELFWPELLEIPFNKEYVMKGPKVSFYRAKDWLARGPARVRRVIRKTRENPGFLIERLGLPRRLPEISTS